MKKLIQLSNRNIIALDTDTLKVKPLKETIRGIDNIYVAPYDSTLINEENDTEIPVKKDDIIVTFYNHNLGRKFVVVTSEEWKTAIKIAEDKEQKDKEEWAAKHKTCESCDCCTDYDI